MMYKQNFVTVIKCDGKILRDDSNGAVYLPFGAEYSVLIKNKDSRRALVDIEVDGKNVLNGHKLIVNGNDTQEIKGFMRDMNITNKFKFIHKTKEIQDYRGDRIDDGLVRITYQFEEIKKPVITTYAPPTWTYYSNYPSTGDIGTAKGCTNIGSGFHSDVYTCSFSAPSSARFGESLNKSFAPKSDEGITVKGSKVNQSYVYGSIDNLESDIYTIVLHLKGMTKFKKEIQKPIVVKTKLTCSSCGRKNKSFNKFCYNCGTFLE